MLAYLRDPGNAAKFGVDTRRMALIGHSMGGWVTAMTAGKDNGLLGAGLISAANMGAIGHLDRAMLVTISAGSAAGLAGTSPEQMADELIAGREANNFLAAAPGLANRPLLVLTSDDDLASQSAALIAAVRAHDGSRVTAAHVATDHSWSDKRVLLQAQVIRWLQSLLSDKKGA